MSEKKPPAPEYNRDHGFLSDQTNGKPTDGAALDRNFDAVSDSVNTTIDNLSARQADDGSLKADTVGEEQLKPGVLDSIVDDANFVIEPLVERAEESAASAYRSAEDSRGSANRAEQFGTAAVGSAGNAEDSALASAASAQLSGESAGEAASSAIESENSNNLATGQANKAVLSELAPSSSEPNKRSTGSNNPKCSAICCA